MLDLTLKLRSIVLLSVLSSFLVSVACSSGSGGREPSSTAAGTAAAETSATPLPTQVPAPTVVGDHVISTGVGYEADIPNGWHLRANILSSETYRGDAYFQPEGSAPDPARPPANIAVGCQLQQGDRSLDQAVGDDVETLTKLRRENVRTADHGPVGSLPARQVDYVFRITPPIGPSGTPTPEAGPEIVLERRDVVFVSAHCVWTVTLSASIGALQQNVPILEQFLAGFRIR